MRSYSFLSGALGTSSLFELTLILFILFNPSPYTTASHHLVLTILLFNHKAYMCFLFLAFYLFLLFFFLASYFFSFFFFFLFTVWSVRTTIFTIRQMIFVYTKKIWSPALDRVIPLNFKDLPPSLLPSPTLPTPLFRFPFCFFNVNSNKLFLMKCVQKISKLKLYLSRQKVTINVKLLFFKIDSYGIPLSFPLVEVPLKLLFWYEEKMYCFISF